MNYNKKTFGFSLIELSIILIILSVLAAIAYPTYTHYVTKTHRSDGQTALLDLAARIEHYSVENNFSYSGITLAALGVKNISPQGFYTLTLSTTANSYLLKASPKKADALCGTLIFNQLGQKSQTGTGTTKDCW